MTLSEYKKQISSPLRQTTLMLLVRPGEILLAMKKRGFGKGRWNGVGGKPDVGEKIEDAAIRETVEEISVKPLSFKHKGIIDFYFPHAPADKNMNQQVMIYVCDSWEGEPKESEEMQPQWYKTTEIPFSQMWPDDVHWLPHVLEGKFVCGEFMFDPNEGIADMKLSADEKEA